ncbi:hypothetical protein Q8F55_008370 [Vanrija albida]|uniref:Amino acid transporter transmembrane domain-containing protein n=1 Tax=Vanrija albida TaxID=181172 RepID=A0ABR3PW09_9TREE
MSQQQAPYAAAPYAAPAQQFTAAPPAQQVQQVYAAPVTAQAAYPQPAFAAPAAGAAPVFAPAGAPVFQPAGASVRELPTVDKVIHPLFTTLAAVLYVVLIILSGVAFSQWATLDDVISLYYYSADISGVIATGKAVSIVALVIYIFLAAFAILAAVATIFYAVRQTIPLRAVVYNIGRIVFPILGLIVFILAIVNVVKGLGGIGYVSIVFAILLPGYVTYVFFLLYKRKVAQDQNAAAGAVSPGFEK